MNSTEQAKAAAAKAALQEIRDDTVIGLGSGSTVAMLFTHLGEEVRNGRLHVKVVPASSQSEMLCFEHRIPLTTLNEHPQLDLVIDGADQVEKKDLVMIKGGGAALLREKILLKSAKRRVIIVDEEKVVAGRLTGPVPVEVLPFSYVSVARKIEKTGGAPRVRLAVKKNGPVVTDNGNFILDVSFPNLGSYLEIDAGLRAITGVIETGLFIGLADKVYVGTRTGEVQVLTKK